MANLSSPTHHCESQLVSFPITDFIDLTQQHIPSAQMALSSFSREWFAPMFGLVLQYTSRSSSFPSKKGCNQDIATPFLRDSVAHPCEEAKEVEIDPEIKELRKVFNTFDDNGDGKLSKEEMNQLLEKLGLSISETVLKSVIDSVDSNMDGFVDFTEFVHLYHSLSAEQRVEDSCQTTQNEDVDLMEAFQVFDKNGDGYITAQELQSVLSSLGFKQGKKLVECRNMITKVDRDGDGRVNFKEFKEMMATGFQGK